ncbi:MAG TPA: valine--tRNA ligase [Candidatus Azoamicus sp.]
MKNTFEEKKISKNWYKDWEDKKYFVPNYEKDKKYCITIPPPNITGSLHMGHAFQCTLMDILIRYHKMNNFCTLWKMGTDHAGIATQILIEQKIKENKNIDKIKYTEKWKKKSNTRIKKQLKKLGCLLNWQTSRFTLDNHFSYAVKTAFIRLYEEKLIYKTNKLVNWDTKLKTAISDLEVVHEELESEIFYIKYNIHNKKENIIIATTRPETIFADVAIAINPKDKRYTEIKNNIAIIPLINRKIPIIEDESVDIKYGSGCLKITPGHDFNDFEIGKKHKLPIINILNQDGTTNDKVPEAYQNLTINEARKKIKTKLLELNLIEKIDTIKNKIPKADRSNSIIEPLITEQWYIKTKPLAELVCKEIKENKIKILPIKWKKIFFNWLDNIKDWCISRQIWWGHRIPIWYDDKKNEYTGYNEKHIIKKYNIDNKIKLTQDKNVLDTWFSSALWPFASLGWPNNKIEYKQMYPTNTLVTGFDIIFFWAIKMMMFGLKLTKNMPFKEIYIHGLIRDNLGNKMSKTKGNVLDPLDIINGITKEHLIKKQTSNLMNNSLTEKIKTYTQNQFPNGIEAFGTDALRLTFCSISTENISIKLDLEKVKTYKSFCTKLWNAAIFIQNTSFRQTKSKKIYHAHNKYINIIWQKTKKEVKNYIKKRKFHLLIETIYNFFWSNFCSWHIECSKALLQDNKYKKETINNNLIIFKDLLKVLHPLAPYITEEIWKCLNEKSNLITEKYPKIKHNFNLNIINYTENIKKICSKIRSLKTQNNKKILAINIKHINNTNLNLLEKNKNIIEKITKLKKINLTFKKENKYDNIDEINIILK